LADIIFYDVFPLPEMNLTSKKLEQVEKELAARHRERENGKVHVENKFREKQEDKSRIQDKIQLLQMIADRDSDMPGSRIKTLISERTLTKEEVTEFGRVDAKLLEDIISTPLIDTPFGTWEKLQPLKPDFTDVYFLGVAFSGKSCLLAGLLSYAKKEGKTVIDIDNQVGKYYFDELVKRVRLGIVPKSTVPDNVNYISTMLEDLDGLMHGVNLVEMSGERFTATYHKATLKGMTSMGAQEYLDNNNRKLIFLVLDYQNEVSGQLNNKPDEVDQIESALGYLHKDGTMSKTDGIIVVVTKCDVIQKAQEEIDLDKAREEIDLEICNFLNNRHRNLLRNLERYKEIHGFGVSYVPFSLGKFEFSDTFQFDPFYSQKIFEATTALTTINEDEVSGGRWGWLKRKFNFS